MADYVTFIMLSVYSFMCDGHGSQDGECFDLAMSSRTI